jgi:multiple sugar transport system substrate-binding protein
MGADAPLSDIHEEKFARFETAVFPVPQFDTENPQMISQGPSVCIFNKSDPQEVLASWLFTQYLLTDGVQIAYSQTEGYVPVTEKAQNSLAYQDYLSRSGENNALYYDIKIKASELLLDNIGNTFVTPVFNGSISIRDAAGQLIENTAKSVRRSETIDAAYIEKLYRDVTALYRLDQIGARNALDSASKSDLGPMPSEAKILLTSLTAVWGIIAMYVIVAVIKRKLLKIN